jgi:hypothetical protein
MREGGTRITAAAVIRAFVSRENAMFRRTNAAAIARLGRQETSAKQKAARGPCVSQARNKRETPVKPRYGTHEYST